MRHYWPTLLDVAAAMLDSEEAAEAYVAAVEGGEKKAGEAEDSAT